MVSATVLLVLMVQEVVEEEVVQEVVEEEVVVVVLVVADLVVLPLTMETLQEVVQGKVAMLGLDARRLVDSCFLLIVISKLTNILEISTQNCLIVFAHHHTVC